MVSRETSAAAELPPAPEVVASAYPEAVGGLTRYAELLASAGVERGLIGPREVTRLWERHLLNCAVVEELLPRGATVVDAGSGAGLPGLVLALVRPDLKVTLVEPMLRRSTFLGEAVETLGLENVVVTRARIEELPKSARFDVVTSRAVAPLDKLAAWCARRVAPGGRMLALKGDRAETELAAAGGMFARYGLAPGRVVRVGEGIVDPPTIVVEVPRPGPDEPAPRRDGGDVRSGPVDSSINDSVDSDRDEEGRSR